jgi:hypothetical protein
MLDIARDRTLLHVPPAPRVIVSWATQAPAGTIELVVHTANGSASTALPYVAFEPGARASLDGFDPVARIATDVVHAASDIVAIDVRANVALDAVAVTVPVHGPPPDRRAFTGELDVPAYAQHDPAQPASRGWCLPASIAMLVAAHAGACAPVAAVADALYDRNYHGTGNWTFAIAYVARYALTGAVAYLRDLRSLDALLDAGLPVAVSIAWELGTLPRAPLERSSGHLVVVRGRTATGDVIVNDPAQAEVRTIYPADAFERAWLGHGGVALLVAPPERTTALVDAANA